MTASSDPGAVTATPQAASLVGPSGFWASCRDAARRGDLDTLDALETSGLIENLTDELPAGPPPGIERRAKALLAAARLAIDGRGDMSHVGAFVYTAVNGLTAGNTSSWNPPERLPVAVDAAALLNELRRFDPHAGLVACGDLLRDIEGSHLRTRSVRIGLPISRHRHGEIAELVLTERPGPVGLFAELTAAPFQRWDAEFESALQEAWLAAEGPSGGRSLRWSLVSRRTGGPIDPIRGPSVGLAAGVALRMLAAGIEPDGRLFTGALRGDGSTASLLTHPDDVAGYAAKLTAAGSLTVVVPASDLAAVTSWAARNQPDARIVGVEHLDHALPPTPAARGDDTAVDACPYQGLARYDTVDADRFFGRDRLVADLVSRCATGTLVGVLGASGAGKSSLVRAGLLAALAADRIPGSADWAVVLCSPGGRPFARLAAALGVPVGDGGELRVTQVEAAVAALLSQRHAASRLVLIVDQLEELFTLGEDPAEAVRFLELLAVLAARSPRLEMVIVPVIRADFYGRTADCAAFGNVLRDNHVLVGPLTEAEMRAVITRPALQAGLQLEPRLVDALLDDAAVQPAVLPLLSTALQQTWQHSRGGGWARNEPMLLTLAAYDEVGRVSGALAKHADAVLRDATTEEQVAMRRLLLRMVVERGELTASRRPTPLSELRGDELRDRSLERLTSNRLVTVEADTAEIVHDALLVQWPTLRGWLDNDRPGRVRFLSVVDRAVFWQQHRSADLLEREPGRLRDAEAWAADHPDEVEPVEAAFLEASNRAMIRRSRRTHMTIAVLATLLAMALVAGGLALSSRQAARAALNREQAARVDADRQADAADAARADADGQRLEAERQRTEAVQQGREADTQRDNAERQRMEAERQKLAAEEQTQLAVVATETAQAAETRSELALAAQVEATAAADAAQRQEAAARTEAEAQRVQAEAAEALAISQAELAELRRQEALIRSVAAQAVAASGSQPDVAMLLAAKGLELAAVYESQVPDALRNPLVSRDAKAAAWSVRTSTPHLAAFLVEDPQHHGAVAFAAGDTRLAEGGKSGTVAFVDTGTLSLVTAPVAAHRGNVSVLRSSPDGRLVASGGNDGTVRIWEPRSGRPTGQVFVHAADPTVDPTVSFPVTRVNGVEFSGDGSLLFTAGDNNVVRTWDVASGRLLATSEEVGRGGILGLDVTPDGRHVLAAYTGGTVAGFGLGAGGTLSRVFHCRYGLDDSSLSSVFMNEVRVDPNGGRFVTVQRSGRVLVWDLDVLLVSGCAGTASLVTTMSNGVLDAAWSDDGSVLAVVGGQNEALIFDGTSDDPLTLPSLSFTSLRGHNSSVRAVAVSRDGATMVTAGDDGNVVLWSVPDQVGGGRRLRAEGEGLATVSTRGAVQAVAVSADSAAVASVSGDGRLAVWDRASGALQLDVMAHRGGRDGGGCETSGLRTGATAVVWLGPTEVVTSGCDGAVLRWNASAGEQLQRYDGLGGAGVSDLAVSGDGTTLAAVAVNGDVLIIDAASGSSRVVRPGVASREAPRVALNRTGRLGAVSDSAAVVLFDAGTGAVLARLQAQVEPVLALAFSPDGAMLASGSRDQTVVLWDVATGRPLHSPLGTYDGVFSVAFTPNSFALGPALVVGSRDQTVHLVDLATGYDIVTPQRLGTRSVYAVAVAPDGSGVVAGDSGGLMAQWSETLTAFVPWACTIAQRDLTAQERDTFLPGEPHTPLC